MAGAELEMLKGGCW